MDRDEHMELEKLRRMLEPGQLPLVLQTDIARLVELERKERVERHEDEAIKIAVSKRASVSVPGIVFFRSHAFERTALAESPFLGEAVGQSVELLLDRDGYARRRFRKTGELVISIQAVDKAARGTR